VARDAWWHGCDGHAKRLRELKGENAKTKNLLAEAHLDTHTLKSVLEVKR